MTCHLFTVPLLAALAQAPCGPSGPPPVKGYTTQISLNGPILPGSAQTISGRGAPAGNGIWVELWRVRSGGARAQSVGSTAAANGLFTFQNVPVAPGDAFHATLSRSWTFRADGDLEGWNGSTNDAVLGVENGALEIELGDLNGDGQRDPWIQNLDSFDPRFYRVVEVRLLNPTPSDGFGIYWGSPWPMRRGVHGARIPREMTSFQTIQFPMNSDETRIDPPPAVRGDGFWDRGALNSGLRLDPFEGLPPGDPSLDGEVFLIDSIRIREDYRREFHEDGDVEGILGTHDLAALGAGSGFLTYTASDVGSFLNPGSDGAIDPNLSGDLQTGRLDVSYFTRFGIGLENAQVAMDPLVIRLFFDDVDSIGYHDDGAGPLQRGTFSIPPLGRRDETRSMDAIAGGEWSEDGGRVPSETLRVDCPGGAMEGDRIRIDYFGWIPESPYGPSEPVVARSGLANPPQVSLGLDGPCGMDVAGEAGARFDADVRSLLTTGANGLGEGAAGWSISIGAEGVTITDITVEGTAAASVTDSPPGIRNDGYLQLEITSGPGNEGAVCAVVLSYEQRVTLPPVGTEAIARLRISGNFPADPGCKAARIFYADGRRGSALPVCNAVAFLGQTVWPDLGECAFQLCAGGATSRRVNYDCEGDGELNISDPICHLNFLFIGGPPPQCEDAMEFNGDGRFDISDPVAALNFLFIGGPPPARGEGCQTYAGCGLGGGC